jgi:hypothetical protein
MPGEAMLSGHCAFEIGKVRLWLGLYTMGNQVKKSGYYYYLTYGDSKPPKSLNFLIFNFHFLGTFRQYEKGYI